MLLKHDTRPAGGRAGPARAGDVHWDMLLDVDGVGPLWSWRLPADPAGHRDAMRAERLADHRRRYLTYEGELTGERGCVERVDAGVMRILCEADRFRLTVSGERLRGDFLLESVEDDATAWTWRLADGSSRGSAE